jgi:hypothetical protein
MHYEYLAISTETETRGQKVEWYVIVMVAAGGIALIGVGFAKCQSHLSKVIE